MRGHHSEKLFSCLDVCHVSYGPCMAVGSRVSALGVVMASGVRDSGTDMVIS